MNISKIAKLVSNSIDSEDISVEERIKRINKLLGKLDKKEDKIRKKYDREKSVVAKKRMKTKLKILKLQRKKCFVLREELGVVGEG